MSTRRIKLSLWLIAGLLTAGAVASLAAAVLWPLDQPAIGPPQVIRPPAAAAAAGPQSSEPLPLSAYERIWKLDLRRPLYDRPAPAVAAAKASPPPPPLMVKLAGTVIEPGYSLALFVTPGGKTEFKGVGDSTGGAEVLQIERDSATLRHNGRTVTLKIPRKDPA